MHLATETSLKRRPPAATWRIALDRAWRSDAVRRAFEAETGLSALVDGSDGRSLQQMTGETQAYHERFLVWATRHLGLEDKAPAFIKDQLAI